MKKCDGMEVSLHAILISALHGSIWSALFAGESHGAWRRGGWVGRSGKSGSFEGNHFLNLPSVGPRSLVSTLRDPALPVFV